ncbi:glycosyl hydrolase family 17 protein [Haliscomenobacter hydrossis]|uniref:Endo-1,3-beta-glucanase btgC n=1 Tax=Haliscomenobacter hydrossis (strain ATCC 27775 / DSM 1100 / LMG 10767 / O) TaxID=760192 RepID=F4L874_HALH1|nr:glycosyl hydrolase family 17 protein [Haliscomenobacter hydrossis]AEE54582.1 glycoside hydrolase family 17 [Haliscomenobacter hydrossis DSM 1100]
MGTKQNHLSFFSGMIILLILAICSCDSKPSKKEAPKKNDKVIKLELAKLKVLGNGTMIATDSSAFCDNLFSKKMALALLLGADSSCTQINWKGGQLKANIFLKNQYASTVYTLKITSFPFNGKAVFSKQNPTFSVKINNRPLFNLGACQLTKNGLFIPAHDSILTTVVVPKSGNFSISISAPEHAVWPIRSIELRPSASSALIKGIGYSPFRDCQMPGTIYLPTHKEIQEDLFRLSQSCNTIRTYAATGVNSVVPGLAKRHNLKVFAGAWIDGVQKEDQKEIAALISLADTVPQLDGLIVGNEYYLRHEKDKEAATRYLLNHIRTVKQEIKDKTLPISTAETHTHLFEWDFTNQITGFKPGMRDIIKELDVLLIHIYPSWNGRSINGAAKFTVDTYLSVQKFLRQKFPKENKRLIIGETGWPSKGGIIGKAVPSLPNQRKFLLEFLSLANKNNVEFMFFDAFDELWKMEGTDGLGQSWGYHFSNRTAKHDLNSVLLPIQALQYWPKNTSKNNVAFAKQSKEISNLFVIYDEWPSKPISVIKQKRKSEVSSNNTLISLGNFYPSGFMGPSKSGIKLSACDCSTPRSGEMAMKITIPFLKSSQPWGGIYWLANNSWNGPGINLTRKLIVKNNQSVILTFWAKGLKGKERVTFRVGGVGNGSDSIPFPVSDTVTLSNKWKQYSISLANENLSNVVGGFCLMAEGQQNQFQKQVTLFLDDIKYEVK